jgi:hypothetical protein
MRIIRAWKWQKKDSVALAIFAAELVIENYEKIYPKDDRPRKAIEAAKNWIKNPRKETESAARSASWSARSASWSAWSAADAAAESARSAARSASWSAADAASIDKINDWLTKHLDEMEEEKDEPT